MTFTPALLAQESPRIDQEAGFVDASPMAPLMKYAFVAGPQAWFHDRHEAALSGATRSFDLGAVGAWRACWYRPDRMTMVVVGGFELDAAQKLVRDTIGAVPAASDPPPTIPAWSSVPRRSSVKWTSAHIGLIVAFDPPAGPTERLALTLLGDLAMERFARDEQVQKGSLIAMPSGRTWAVGGVGDVGGLPLFVYATLRPELDRAEQERVITERFIAALRDSAASGMWLMAVASLENQAIPAWDQAQTQGKQIFGNRPGFHADPGGLVLLHHALQTAMRDRVAGDAKVLASVKTLTPDQLKAIVDRATAPEKKFVTVFTP